MKPLETPTIARRGSREGANLFDELIVDNFAGAGGASMGIEAACGRSVDIAINHDRHSVVMHQLNHPHTRHLCEDVWHVDPVEATADKPIGLAWFSPDCRHFSRAKGGKPVKKNIRGLAWVVIRWAKRKKPRIIILENVREFQDWGPLTDDDRPCPICRDRVQRIAPSIELMPTGFPDSCRVSMGIRAPKGVEIMRSEIDVRGPSPLEAALPAAKALIGGGK